MRKQKSRPVAVVIADVHYNINTLEVADKAIRIAIAKANALKVPLIVAGDLHDTKANLRGECMNAMLASFSLCEQHAIVLRGNHCSINEKSDEHSLSFMPGQVIQNLDAFRNMYFIAYQHSKDIFQKYLDSVPDDTVLIMHQGVQDSNAGHYIQDKSAIPKEWLSGRRVISGHYHARQTIDLPEGGMLDYVGNPYTLGFGEANDPEKGFQVLYDDGSLEFIPTNLRKHVIYDMTLDELYDVNVPFESPNGGDIVWLKITGSSDRLAKETKENIAEILNLEGTPFRLDLIPTATAVNGRQVADKQTPQNEMLDNLIEALSNVDSERKDRLKTIWKQLIGG